MMDALCSVQLCYKLCYKSHATSSDLHASPGRLPWYTPAGSRPVPFIRETVQTKTLHSLKTFVLIEMKTSITTTLSLGTL